MISPLKRLYKFAISSGWPGQLLADDDQLVGYDAIKDRGRRRPSRRRVYPQDRKLRNHLRERAIATAQDLQQNFATAAWAIRRHLDYVSTLVFQAKTGNDELNRDIEDFMRWWSKKENCDVRRRHSLRRLIRMAESRRTVDGDVGFLKVGGVGRNRGKLQAIEAYRVQNPTVEPSNIDPAANWINGVRIDTNGANLSYAIHHRDMEGVLQFDRFVSARQMVWLGYYERFDQVRGISPMLPALNLFTDCYEGVDMALAKMKVNQLFALAFYRDAVVSEDYEGGPTPTRDTDEDGVPDAGYDFDFGSGPQLMDLEPGDKAEFLESKSPPQETVEFLKFVLSLSVKCLDLPDSFLWEDKTNFFGSRAALNHYLRSAEPKVLDLIEAADEITAWRLGMAFADGELSFPAGMDWSDIEWTWKPKGSPWWNPVQEVSGAKQSMAAGVDNIERICTELGTDVQENIEINARWQQYSRELTGQPLVWATSTSANMSETSGTEVTSDVDE